MSAASKIMDGLSEALAIAKGEAEPHKVHTFPLAGKPNTGPSSPAAREGKEVAATNQPETANEMPSGMVSGSDDPDGDQFATNSESSHVDRSAARAHRAGEVTYAPAGQAETRTKAEVIDGNASLAAREGEQAAAQVSHSSADLLPSVTDKAEALNPSTEASATLSHRCTTAAREVAA